LKRLLDGWHIVGGNSLDLKSNVQVPIGEWEYPGPEIPVANPQMIKPAAIQVPSALEELDRRRIDQEFLVPVGFGFARPRNAWTLMKLKIGSTQEGNVSDLGRDRKQGIIELHGSSISVAKVVGSAVQG
jgi:hypothetical protein